MAVEIPLLLSTLDFPNTLVGILLFFFPAQFKYYIEYI